MVNETASLIEMKGVEKIELIVVSDIRLAEIVEIEVDFEDVPVCGVLEAVLLEFDAPGCAVHQKILPFCDVNPSFRMKQ